MTQSCSLLTLIDIIPMDRKQVQQMKEKNINTLSILNSIGFLFVLYKESSKKFILNPFTILISILGYAILDSYFGQNWYELVWAKFHSPYFFTPILSSIFCIIIFYNLSCAIALLFSEDNFVYKIGQNTFAIMVFHLSIFFMINLVLFSLGYIQFESLSDAYYHFNVEHLWPIYSGLGILIPTLGSIYFKKLKAKYQQTYIR